jgi:hypothetical protein
VDGIKYTISKPQHACMGPPIARHGVVFISIFTVWKNILERCYVNKKIPSLFLHFSLLWWKPRSKSAPPNLEA